LRPGLGLVGGLAIAAVAVLLFHVVDAAPALAAASVYRGTAACITFTDNGRAVAVKQALVGPLCNGLANMSQTLAARIVGAVEPAGTAASPAFPLKVSANGRYLVDQRDVPFLLVGDSPQALFGQLSDADAQLFFEDRRTYGFNTLWINLLCNDYTGCNSDGSTSEGVVPFSVPGDLSTPNEEYFARADRLIQMANQYGILVVLDPIETGGWLSTLRANGPEKAYAFGRYLGSRFGSNPNIIWMHGNDFQSWRDPDDDALALAVASGLRDADPSHLQTVELDYYDSSSRDDSNWESLLQLEAAYTYFPTYAEVLKDYNRPDARPVFVVEANYEFEHFYSGPQTLRRQVYWTLLSGATGHLYGNKYTWPFAPGWKAHLDTIGALETAYATRLFATREWFNLIPDQEHTLVTDGYGSYSDAGDPNQNNFVTAARTADGSLAIVYIPSGGSFTVNMRQMTPAVDACWFDPANGTYTRIEGAPQAQEGEREFHTPVQNADGDTDWVLVLEANCGAPSNG
jgi:hypothetical protein